MRQFRVLVFPGGTEIGLEIWHALGMCKEIRLYSAGMDVSNHAPFVFERHSVLPGVDSADWLERLNGILVQESIDYIFPAHDDVIVALAENQQKIPARIVSSPLETCLITRSKSRTYELFRDVLPVPEQYRTADAIPEYPVFIKPDKGQGSQGTLLVNSPEQLRSNFQKEQEHIILEYLSGPEYTVDCFSDRERGLLFCSGRQRVRIRSGISMDSRPVSNSLFEKYARLILSKVELHGAWFFQVKEDKHGTWRLLEIAPRIAGTMALNRVRGVNFPLLSIYEQERYPLQIMFNPIHVEIDRALVNRYRHTIHFRSVYMDLDDTLLLNNKVNILVIAFLYQCVNKGIKLTLLTKHAHDLNDTLKKHRLLGVFDHVIQLSAQANKSDYVTDKEAIFIDDSFSERKRVHESCGVQVFDCSMLEMLMDERI